MIAAPSCSHRYAVSAISSGVTGTCGVSFFLGTDPVGATVMMSLSMPQPVPAPRRFVVRVVAPRGWPAIATLESRDLGKQVARHLDVRRDALQLRLCEFVQGDPDATVRPLDRCDRLQAAELLRLRLDHPPDRRLGVRRRGW